VLPQAINFEALQIALTNNPAFAGKLMGGKVALPDEVVDVRRRATKVVGYLFECQ
jgi:hypothetical protein